MDTKHISKFLLIFCFIGFSLGQLARIPIADGVAITLLDVGVLLFVSHFIFVGFKRHAFSKPRLTLPIGIFVFTCVLSLLFGSFSLLPNQLLIASLYLLRWVLYAGVYFAMINVKDLKEHTLLQYFIYAGVVQLVLGLVQYFYLSDLRKLYHLGWDDHLYRLVGVFIDPNYQGASFVLLLIILFPLLVKQAKRFKSRQFFGYSFLILLTISEIVLTYSRSALLMLGASLIGFFVILGNKKMIAFLSLCALFFIIIFSNTYIEGLNPFRTASVYARISSMKEASAIVADNPVIGVGFNAFRYAQNRYGFRTSEKWQTSHADAGTDNSFLFILATTGIIGFLAYLNLLRCMFVIGIEKLKNKSLLPMIATISILALIVDSFFVNSLFYTFFLFWLWVLVGATENT